MIERAVSLSILLIFVATFSWLLGWQRGLKDASAIEARRAETLGSVHESAVPKGDAQ